MSDATITTIGAVAAALVTAAATVYVAVLNRRTPTDPVTRVPPERRAGVRPPTRDSHDPEPFMSDDYVARVVAEIRKNEQTGDDCAVDDGHRR